MVCKHPLYFLWKSPSMELGALTNIWGKMPI